MQHILCTVGTSLLTNRDDRPWAGWYPRGDRPLPDAESVDAWLTTADASAASAETNTLARLELSKADVLTLLHSDTPEGRFCTERLQTLYRGTVREVTLEKIGKLGYGADHFTAGLKALVDVTIRKVHEARAHGMTPLFCATGGFKAEIAFLNLMGALLGIEVVYIHELHRELVRLPCLPLTWDAEFVARHEDFFRWIDEEPRKSAEVESWLKGRPELRPLVEDGDDGCTYLSAAGDLLYRVAKEQRSLGPRAVWPQADPRPPQEKNCLSGVEHHRPSGWERFVKRLCAVDSVTSVHYDPKARGGARVTIIDGQNGILGVCYSEQGNALPLRVETTARGQAQIELVADYLRQLK
ncbi:MAG: putative CRISPR-associated protein [Deltaproteobacteria bacterium]|nr:putative CRISPR-associated protein [Deltaproteobacteria bacterium]